METWMKFLQRPVTILKDNQRQGRWDKLEVYLSDHERPWKTTNDPVISFVSYGNNTKYLWRPPTTLKDRQRLAVSKFGAKSSRLNEDFERPLTTMKDCQRPWKTANGWQWFPTTQIFERPSTTPSNRYRLYGNQAFKLLLLAPNLLTASRWRCFRVVGGRQRYFVVSIWHKWNDRLVGSLRVVHGRLRDLEFIPATQSFAVFEGRYLSLQKFHSCFQIDVQFSMKFQIW